MQELLLSLYHLLSAGTKNIQARQSLIKLRKIAFHNLQSGFIKQAFDTRRIDQETQYNPRRNLQHYHRSQAFVSENMAQKLTNFAKLREAVQELENQYGREHQWQDSNARVLLATLNNGLRTMIKDGDYSECQPSMGSLDYIEQLLEMRYRLTFDDLTKMGVSQLKQAILAKDEDLTQHNINPVIISKQDVGQHSYDTLIEKLFGGVQATKENPNVERTVTITVRDSFLDK